MVLRRSYRPFYQNARRVLSGSSRKISGEVRNDRIPATHRDGEARVRPPRRGPEAFRGDSASKAPGDAGVAYNAENRPRGDAGLTGGVEPSQDTVEVRCGCPIHRMIVRAAPSSLTTAPWLEPKRSSPAPSRGGSLAPGGVTPQRPHTTIGRCDAQHYQADDGSPCAERHR